MMTEWLTSPWPWYVAGPIIGLIVPALLLIGGRQFGVSANLRHLCAATAGGCLPLFRYDWRREGAWNLIFALGLVLGGTLAWLASGGEFQVAIAESTRADLRALGITDLGGLVPPQLASWGALATPAGVLVLVGGGFLVGFGARWAGGCTSGHAIAGLAALQLPSLLAVIAFFVGGLAMTHLILPLLL